jgi:hypothetical protein
LQRYFNIAKKYSMSFRPLSGFCRLINLSIPSNNEDQVVTRVVVPHRSRRCAGRCHRFYWEGSENK